MGVSCSLVGIRTKRILMWCTLYILLPIPCLAVSVNFYHSVCSFCNSNPVTSGKPLTSSMYILVGTSDFLSQLTIPFAEVFTWFNYLAQPWNAFSAWGLSRCLSFDQGGITCTGFVSIHLNLYGIMGESWEIRLTLTFMSEFLLIQGDENGQVPMGETNMSLTPHCVTILSKPNATQILIVLTAAPCWSQDIPVVFTGPAAYLKWLSYWQLHTGFSEHSGSPAFAVANR